jgi:hypothetical protein
LREERRLIGAAFYSARNAAGSRFPIDCAVPGAPRGRDAMWRRALSSRVSRVALARAAQGHALADAHGLRCEGQQGFPPPRPACSRGSVPELRKQSKIDGQEDHLSLSLSRAYERDQGAGANPVTCKVPFPPRMPLTLTDWPMNRSIPAVESNIHSRPSCKRSTRSLPTALSMPVNSWRVPSGMFSRNPPSLAERQNINGEYTLRFQVGLR